MNYITPILLALNGGIQAPGAWRTVSLIYAVLSTVFVFCLGLFTREKEVPEAESEKGQAASGGPSFSKLLKIVLRTRYTWILVAIFTMFYLYNGVHGIVPFFFRDVMGNINLYGTSSLINMAAPLIGITVSPRLFAKFGRKKIIINGMIFYVIFNVIIFLFHNIAYVFWPCQILRGLSQSPMITAIFVFVADLVDHIRKKYHVRVEEIASMTSSIGTKVGSGLGTAMVGWSLGIFKYDPASKIQSEVTQNGIVFTMAVVPAIVATLVIVAMHFWDI
jgi:GPH family glycoside/pentoside/hexuronide:cation symporter